MGSHLLLIILASCRYIHKIQHVWYVWATRSAHALQRTPLPQRGQHRPLRTSPSMQVFFVNNVSIKSELTFGEETSLERLQEALGKALGVFGIKLVAPLRTLALRFLEANHGFLELHTALLIICKYLHTPADALPVLEYPGMFKHMRKPAQVDFILQACDIYIDLRRYSQAYEWAMRAGKMELRDERTASVAKRLIILSIYTGKPLREINDLTNRAFSILEQSLAMMSDVPPLGRKEKDWEKERF
jgi:hypothetical protein